MEDCGNSDSTHWSGQESDRTLSLTPPSLYLIGKGEYKVSVTKKRILKKCSNQIFVLAIRRVMYKGSPNQREWDSDNSVETIQGSQQEPVIRS